MDQSLQCTEQHYRKRKKQGIEIKQKEGAELNKQK